jgi:hypothetical protein
MKVTLIPTPQRHADVLLPELEDCCPGFGVLSAQSLQFWQLYREIYSSIALHQIQVDPKTSPRISVRLALISLPSKQSAAI